jgi:glutamate formiminotransferase/formiminotetrahydrofolate cyclodeaminase
MRLVECVPNFSEGRDKAKLDAIADAIRAVPGVSLLDVDAGADTNRTVFTLVGEPDAAVEAAFRAIARAAELIDMSTHKGAHPRMGATDVCPFVPVTGVTMDECVELAHRLGKRVGTELGIPVYLYEYAATRPERQNLADVRAGEYEALPEKMRHPDWVPDYGPHAFHAGAGATVIGAREFLVAYNINLNTRDTRLAKDLANTIREAGKNKRGPDGKFVRDANGEIVKEPGLFKFCKATGWYLPEHGLAQVTMNLTNYRVTPVHVVFDKVCELAAGLGLRVTGSEIVGLVPLEAMLAAGRHYLAKQGAYPGVSEAEVVATAIRSLGLRELSPFEPEQKIIEHRVRHERPLASLRVERFLDELASDSPAPGGGSVAALCAALAASLAAMVPALTHGKKGFADVRDELGRVGVRAQALKAAYRELIDRDTDAFNAVMTAVRLPKGSPAEVAAREAALLEANKGATRVPLELLVGVAAELPPLIEACITRGNPNSASDAGVSALTARAALEGAYLNVLINLPGINDPAFVAETRAAADRAFTEGSATFEALAARVRSELARRLDDQRP